MLNKKMVNLLPQEKETKIFDFKKLGIKKTRYLIGVAAVLFLMIVLQIVQAVTIRSYSSRLSAQTKQLNDSYAKLRKLKGVSVKLKTPLDTLEKTKEDIAAKISFLNNYIFNKLPWDSILLEIQAILPKGVWLNELNLSDTVVSIKCSTLDSSLISVFMKKLNRSIFFRDAKLTFSEKSSGNESEVINFHIGCAVENQKK
jgi:Tfp pilus assembly protein PilN